jgi:hypothetical protein
MKYSVIEKPLELNLMSAAPWSAAGGPQNNTQVQPMAMGMPYPYYPPPQQMFYSMQWVP